MHALAAFIHYLATYASQSLTDPPIHPASQSVSHSIHLSELGLHQLKLVHLVCGGSSGRHSTVAVHDGVARAHQRVVLLVVRGGRDAAHLTSCCGDVRKLRVLLSVVRRGSLVAPRHGTRSS